MKKQMSKQMSKRITLIAVILAVATLAAAPIVQARPGSPGRHGMGAGPGAFGILGHLRHVKEELDLTDEQAGQIKTIFAEVREKNAQYREQLRGGRGGAADVLLANPSDIAGAQAVLDRQAATERLVKQNLLSATAKALAVLNADQRAKLSTLRAERAERRGR
jgi:Spy/CpxP family protein refolding chaperone